MLGGPAGQAECACTGQADSEGNPKRWMQAHNPLVSMDALGKRPRGAGPGPGANCRREYGGDGGGRDVHARPRGYPLLREGLGGVWERGAGLKGRFHVAGPELGLRIGGHSPPTRDRPRSNRAVDPDEQAGYMATWE
jgi:hypothetical protein